MHYLSGRMHGMVFGNGLYERSNLQAVGEQDKTTPIISSEYDVITHDNQAHQLRKTSVNLSWMQ